MSDPLFAPFTIKKLTLRNRIVSTSHEPAYGEDGLPKDRYRAYHREKARGGVGLTMMGGSALVSPDSTPVFGNLQLYRDEAVPYLRALSDDVHEQGAAVMTQLTHMGHRTDNYTHDWIPALSASGTREPAHRAFSRVADVRDLARIARDFADAALRCKEGGLDGVEISAWAGHLLDEFLTPALNLREDEYGGCLENRIRFPLEVIGAVRAAVGDDFVVGMRMSFDDQRPSLGVEPDDAASMKAAITAGERVVLPHVGLFADGVAVAQAGEETFRICRELLDGIVTVSGDEICAAIKDIFDDTRAVAEPAGALALAGLKRYREQSAGHGPLIAINSGANLNFDRLQHVAERAQIGERSEALLAVTIPERPGSYRQFIRLLGRRQITEFNYRYAAGGEAHIFVGVQLTDGEREKQQTIALLREHDYPVLDLSDNELAKLHVRHMVGGRAASAENELVYRFEFPERPGALLRFLELLRSDWNISMFHYRNHGTDFARVLAGLQVSEADRATFEGFLNELGYPFWEETQNPAYRLFLDGR